MKNYIMNDIERMGLELKTDEMIDNGGHVYVSACSDDEFLLTDDGTIYFKEGQTLVPLAFTSRKEYEEMKKQMQSRAFN